MLAALFILLGSTNPGILAELIPPVVAPGEEVTVRLHVTRQTPEVEPDLAAGTLLPLEAWRAGASTMTRRYRVPLEQPAGELVLKGSYRGAALALRLCVDPALGGPALAPDPKIGWAFAAALRQPELKAGGHTAISVWVEPVRGRYIYAMNEAGDGAWPTRVELELPPGFSLAAPFAEPTRKRKADEFLGDFFVHPGRVRFFSELRVASTVKPGNYTLRGTIDAMACNAESCLPATRRPFAMECRIQ